MSTYQIYDFIKDIDFHIENKKSIDLSSKSDAFKIYLFQLKTFQLKNKIKKSHLLFKESYFLIVMYSVLYVAKKRDYEELKFDYIDILGGMKLLRQKKLKKIFK